MSTRFAVRFIAALCAASLAACGPAESGDSGVDSAKSSALAASTIVSIALANVGKGACSTNSSGSRGYASSCTGNGGSPEYWCADFARWVWAAAGVPHTDQLTAGAGSFFVYGQRNGTLHNTPHIGDAVVFNYQGSGYADHVALVTQVNADGSIETVSGDWDGQSGSEATFSSTSHVVLNAPAYASTVGSYSGAMGMSISGFISPLGLDAAAPTSVPLNQQYVAVLHTLDGKGYWIVAADGGVFAYGDAAFYGSTGNLHLNAPIVGAARAPDGKGYWLVAADGGVFAFGSAGFHGSTGNIKLNAPVVGIAAAPDGQGYWLVAADGGIFAFGSAGFHGSTGSIKLNAPVTGMAATPDGQGYWLVAADGGVFAFGSAKFQGSMGSVKLNAPVYGISAATDGNGYWMVGHDGGIFNFGSAGFFGSRG